LGIGVLVMNFLIDIADDFLLSYLEFCWHIYHYMTLLDHYYKGGPRGTQQKKLQKIDPIQLDAGSSVLIF
jgi:hypothetical protein